MIRIGRNDVRYIYALDGVLEKKVVDFPTATGNMISKDRKFFAACNGFAKGR